MFNNQAKTVDVSIRMIDGAVIRGSLMIGQGASIEGAISKETPFLEFLSKDGQRKFVAKHQIAYVEPVEPLKKPFLKSNNDGRFVDAFTMLGLRPDCTFDEAKDAYRRLSKQYHPDNYAGLDLPDEVAKYVTDMFQQINTAFTEVRSEINEAA